MDCLLPPEVLSHIFSFLHIDDRKNVRLVCKRWKLCCNCPAIINRERFCFRSGYCTESIDSFLQTCEQLRSTIEFQDFTQDEFPCENTWQLIGEKIRSVSLTHCDIWNGLTKSIILYCPNLESYKFTKFFNRSDNIDNLIFSPEILDELIQLNTERRKMTSFKLFISGHQLPENILQKIFKIYPCIRTYSIGHISYTENEFHTYYPSILQDFINPSSIKELTINLASDCLWLRKLTAVSQLRLRKLETICVSQSESDITTLDNLLHFLRNQPELQILKIGWIKKQDIAEELLFQILSVCPELVDLRLKSTMPLKMNSFLKILQKISKSKLECIVLGFSPVCNPNDVIEPPTPFANKILHTLKLTNRFDVIPENYCLPLLKHFCHLRHLEIAVASNKVLQTIFQYHIHLQRLVLRKIGNCTSFGFTGQNSHSTSEEEMNYSISRLSKLEHLDMDGFLEHCYVEKTLKEFNFPRLTYLRLGLWGLTEEVTFEYLCTAVPFVEILKIDEVSLREDELLSFCRQMPRLKLLFNKSFHNKETIKQLFSLRPSLKYVVDECDNAYCVDRFTKSLDMVNFRCLNFRQRICGHLRYFSTAF